MKNYRKILRLPNVESARHRNEYVIFAVSIVVTNANEGLTQHDIDGELLHSMNFTTARLRSGPFTVHLS